MSLNTLAMNDLCVVLFDVGVFGVLWQYGSGSLGKGFRAIPVVLTTELWPVVIALLIRDEKIG